MQAPWRGAFDRWFSALERRHLADLSFSEVRRGAEALSRAYLERGAALGGGKALEGRGKRAAFALLYGPLHFLLLAHVVEALALRARGPVLDLGCGTGVGAAAWALAAGAAGPRPLQGVDLSPWALAEARWNWRQMGLSGRAWRARAEAAPLQPAGAIVAAFVLNELPEAARERLVERLLALQAAPRAPAVLIVEPVARGIAPFWRQLEAQVLARGGTSREHRLQPALPERLRLLRQASKRNARELTARSLSLPAR